METSLHYNTITQPPSPYWAAETIDVGGNETSQKGRHALVVVHVGGDGSAYDCSFPAHPDGARYLLLHSSTEFHSLVRNQTSYSFKFYMRKLTNVQGVGGEGDASIVILV